MNDLHLFNFDASLMASPEAQRAHKIGLLRAKSEALKSAQRLVSLGRPLLFGVLAVSFVHLWHQVALIKPAGIEALILPAIVHHISAGLLTLAVDAVALYLVS